MKHFTYLFLFFVFAITQFISAQIPNTISYQGVLTDNKGNPVPDGNVSLTFRLYNASEGGDTLWQESQKAAVSKGIFNVILGSNEPLNLPFDEQYWLGITIEGNNELTPRNALTSSPYSLNSHSTLAELQPGQNLLIKNSGGEITHALNANGDVKHTGTGTFLGGIVVGDTAAVPFDTLTGKSNKNIELLKNSTKKKTATNIPEYGMRVSGSEFGVLGDSHDGIGVQGQSTKNLGVFGYSKNGNGIKGYAGEHGDGVYGESVMGNGLSGYSRLNKGADVSGFIGGIIATGWGSASFGVLGSGKSNGVIGKGFCGVWSQGRLRLDSVPPAPNLDHFLVWDPVNHYVKYRILPAGSGSFDGTLDDTPLVLRDAKGDTVFSVMTNGESIHKGEETFFDGITLTDTSYRSGILIDKNSIQIYDDSPDILGIKIPIGILGSRRFEYLNPVYLYDTLELRDISGNIITMFAPDGTSLHTGDETFEGDVILKGPRGKGIKLIDDNGTTLAGFGRNDLDTGQRLGVYGRAQQPGDLAGAFDGDVDVRGEITATSLHIVDADKDTLVDFFDDGTSLHKGLETYQAGLKVTNTDGSSAVELVPNTNPVTEYGVRVNGNVMVNGILNASVIQAETKQFRIDDPLDPEHKYLNHTSVESSEMKNVYDGDVVLDRNGEAVVSLPAWFQALNIDYRYQLTCIGGYAPVYIKEEIHNNRFKIAGGQKGLKVCWQVTGIRNDKFAREHRMKVVTDKH